MQRRAFLQMMAAAAGALAASSILPASELVFEPAYVKNGLPLGAAGFNLRDVTQAIATSLESELTRWRPEFVLGSSVANHGHKIGHTIRLGPPHKDYGEPLIGHLQEYALTHQWHIGCEFKAGEVIPATKISAPVASAFAEKFGRENIRVFGELDLPRSAEQAVIAYSPRYRLPVRGLLYHDPEGLFQFRFDVLGGRA